MSNTGMNILITGAAGFLGSHLTDSLLDQGHRVTGLDSLITGSTENIAHLHNNPNFTFIKHDLTAGPMAAGIEGLPESIRPSKARFDRIYHMASPASPVGYVKHQVVTLKINTLASMVLMELAEANKARIFVASTSECYGDPLEHPQTETYWGHVNPNGMRSMYDEAKRCMEAIAMAYHRERGVDTRIVRIFNTYGPRLAIDDGRVIVAFIKQCLKNEPITVQGDGSQTRSLCYVEDEIRGFIKLMEYDGGPEGTTTGGYHLPVNIGNPDEVSVLQMAREIRELTGSKSEIRNGQLPPDDPKQRCPNITLAKKLLKWEPRIQRREGFERTIAFYRAKLEA